MQTGMEWLDVTETVNRSYDDVYADIMTEGGQFEPNSWRYATAREVEELAMNWFGFDASQIVFTYLNGGSASDLDEFVSTFGDTMARFVEDAGFGITFDEESAGFTYGLINSTELFEGSTESTRSLSFFSDMNYLMENGERYDGPDIVAAQYGFISTYESYPEIGSFLVRDVSSSQASVYAQEVNEPASFYMMFSAAIAMFFWSNKRVSLKGRDRLL
ncbi:MAG: hypothetical protein CMN72_00030 [Sphingomonas sp.]|nr:hypothetical protein [Sphingomonas sp.]